MIGVLTLDKRGVGVRECVHFFFSKETLHAICVQCFPRAIPHKERLATLYGIVLEIYAEDLRFLLFCGIIYP